MSAKLKLLGLETPTALAPLAGITDLPFRALVQRFGAGMVVSEMVASQEMVSAKSSTRDRAELGANKAGTSVQLAGREAHWMAEAAKLVADQGAERIDINMGCPAKKVTSGYSGAALMRDLDHALDLIDAVVGAVEVPVTLKMRLGWDAGEITAPALAKRAEAAGIAMLAVHGRTRCQFYKGQADWSAIRAVVRAVSIPVLANGDITDTETAKEALRQSGAAGVMIGRGAQGRPWAVAEVAHGVFGQPAPFVPRAKAFRDMVVEHFESMLAFYGPGLGARVARKHLGWYMDQVGTPKEVRRDVLTAEAGAVPGLLDLALCTYAERAVA